VTAMKPSAAEGKAGGLIEDIRTRDTLLLVGAMIGLVGVSLSYLIYALGLYEESRWKPLAFWIGLLAAPTVGIILYFCFVWAKAVNAFDKVLKEGREPTLAQAAAAVRSIYDWISKGSALTALSVAAITLFTALVLQRHHGYSRTESGFVAVFGLISGLNLGIIFYYAGKISERRRLGLAVERLLAAGVYDWDHFRLGIRYKIFIAIFTVVAYLLCSAILMGFSLVQNLQKGRLEDELAQRLQQESELLGADPASNSAKVAGAPRADSLRTSLVVLDQNGVILSGDARDLSRAEIQSISRADSAGRITDYGRYQLVLYAPIPARKLVVAAIGNWGASLGVYWRTRGMLFFLSLATILLSLLATYLLASDIGTPINKIFHYLRGLSGGEAPGRLGAYSEDEMGGFARELARTTALLEAKTARAEVLLAHIREIAQAVEVNADQVESATQEQSGQVHGQASAIAEVLSTSQEIAATARQITKSAVEAQQSAELNLQSCRSGGDRVGQALRSFKALGDYVEKLSAIVVGLGKVIGKITGVAEIIQEIADQINLLSLNAELEATAAGEAGKRFGVVADEVRRLAVGAMDSVAAIRALVESTVDSTRSAVETARQGQGLAGEGSRMADAVGQTIREIEHQAEITVAAAGQITTITVQQKQASEQMAETVSEIDSSSREIKSNAEKVLAAMERLSQAAKKLGDEFTGTGDGP
jgi:methyl-accepting chemotaxis protein